VINQQEAYIASLEEEKKVWGLWSRERADLLAKNAFLQEQLEMTVILKKVLEETQRTAEILSSTLARQCKRQRGDE
jgi:hypothetical protein